MSFILRVRPQGGRDIDRFVRYLAVHVSENIARRYLLKSIELFGKLETQPEHGSRWDSSDPRFDGILYRTPRRFKNHVVFYQVLEDTVEIIRVLHASQDIKQALHELDN